MRFGCLSIRKVAFVINFPDLKNGEVSQSFVRAATCLVSPEREDHRRPFVESSFKLSNKNQSARHFTASRSCAMTFTGIPGSTLFPQPSPVKDVPKRLVGYNCE